MFKLTLLFSLIQLCALLSRTHADKTITFDQHFRVRSDMDEKLKVAIQHINGDGQATRTEEHSMNAREGDHYKFNNFKKDIECSDAFNNGCEERTFTKQYQVSVKRQSGNQWNNHYSWSCMCVVEYTINKNGVKSRQVGFGDTCESRQGMSYESVTGKTMTIHIGGSTRRQLRGSGKEAAITEENSPHHLYSSDGSGDDSNAET